MSDHQDDMVEAIALPTKSEPAALDRGPGCITVLVVLAVVNTLVILLIWQMKPNPLEGDQAAAQVFLDGLVFGIADAPDQDATGYSIAYDQLSSSAQKQWDYAAFAEHFENNVSEWGFLLSWTPLSEEKGSIRSRRLAYRLDFEGREDRPLSFHCELTVIPEGDDHRIEHWSLTPMPTEGR